MSLGNDALKVGREPKRIRHSKEVSLANLRMGTTPALYLFLIYRHVTIFFTICCFYMITTFFSFQASLVHLT